ncbi:MAG: 3-deoxy-8-phosphooctulonate synthase [Thermoanaerobaculia bacterium]|nr:3-deoxy-8-phosphooctulonate synthase [Thermoanaerobaculia bacterium]
MIGGPAGSAPLPVISGPCALESEELAFEVAHWLQATAARVGFAAIFKSSYDKANRSSLDSYRGPGLERGLEILQRIKSSLGLPVLTDVHEVHEVGPAAEVCDVLQIPAFLCRQTDLVVAAAKTGRAVNIKKGQFLAPMDMAKIVDKARRSGNERVTVTERGFSFGYNNLVVDMRAFAMMHREGIPVIFDVTHALQLPGGGQETGGAREYAEPLAKAALAAGADGVFLEVHPNPEKALSDSTTQLPPGRAERLLGELVGSF